MKNRREPGDRPRLPPWMRKRISPPGKSAEVDRLLGELGLETVCGSAHCPNRPECFSRGTAAFMILGDVCTRDCRFCAVPHGDPSPPRADEPSAVASAAERLKLRHAVVTSPARDDLPDGGASQFARTIAAVRARLPHAAVEVLIPDFMGDPAALDEVLAARPDVFNHNVETVGRLYPEICPEADYRRSLAVLGYAVTCPPGDGEKPLIKSGIMLGLGESDAEVRRLLRHMRGVGVDALTMGQYLSPTPRHVPVVRFVPPEEFAAWKAEALEMGFAAVAAAPHVRSSYYAEDLFEAHPE